MDASTLGERIRNVRRRRGLTQRELATAAAVSESLIKKLEQGQITDVRLETLHKIAVALHVPTTALAVAPDAPEPEQDSVRGWELVRQALVGGNPAGEELGEPTLPGVRAEVHAAVSAVQDSRYEDLRATLPALLRDADALVSISTDSAQPEARRVRSQLRQVTAYMLGQVWQFPAALEAADLALGDADDRLDAMAAADWKCWLLLRQGRLSDCADLAVRWADDAEPRMSKATADELAAWGRFLVQVSSAAVRDNRPDDARKALRLARMAAAGIGTDMSPSSSPWQEFGQATIARVAAENATIQGHPDVTLSISAQITAASFRIRRNWNRNRLDVAHAHAAVREYAEAVAVLQDVRATAPEWLAQQRYARDILGRIIERRRTLTPEMRELADAVRLPL
jgi:transcriptional regulator with XRE-family HTH domain